MELFQVDTVEEAIGKTRPFWGNFHSEVEKVALLDALGRILGEDINCSENVPSFPRSTIDGYAVKAKNVFGASDTIPTFLTLVGQVEMGEETDLEIGENQGAYVPTGGMIPKGADAVVMIEYVDVLDEKMIGVLRPIAPGENIMQVGEDMKEGACILTKGTKITAPIVGMLAALGITDVPVYKKLKVSVFTTGDEIVPPSQSPKVGEVRDINSYVLMAMLREIGLEVVHYAILQDDYELIKRQVSEAKKISDIVMLSGGSSVGKKDWTINVLSEMGSPGILTHGIAIKPGKPTIIAMGEDTLFLGLPGHPASATIVFHAIITPILHGMMGRKTENSKSITIEGVLQSNIHAAPGRRTYQLVMVKQEDTDYLVFPIWGKSGAVSPFLQADGFVVIHEHTEGYEKNDIVNIEVWRGDLF